jgi:hypothetical protein
MPRARQFHATPMFGVEFPGALALVLGTTRTSSNQEKKTRQQTFEKRPRYHTDM